MSIYPPKQAMVLAAGLGTRMRPLTDRIPKPLVEIASRSLLDRGLDNLKKAGVEKLIVNIHHLGQQIVEHLEKRNDFSITISDERSELLDSAGGVVKALPYLDDAPFYILNADTFWIDGYRSTLLAMADFFDGDGMDMLLMTVRRDQAAGPERGDFLMDDMRHLVRAAENIPEAVIYAGVILTHKAVFAGARAEKHSLNLYFDRAIGRNRLYGFPLEGHWYTVGNMEMITHVEGLLAERQEA